MTVSTRSAPALLAADSPSTPRLVVSMKGLTALLGVVGLLGVAGLWLLPGAERTGVLRVETDTAGARVTVDGTYRGQTPTSLSLPPGEHRVEVTQGAATRLLPVTVAAGTTTIQHVSWQASPAVPTTGAIEITSDPTGQSVTVDGTSRGVTPLTVADLSPGEHEVVIRRDGTPVRRTVQVEAGATAALMFTGSATAGVSSGWLTATVPVPLEIHEGTRLIGTTQSDRILLPVGRHDLEFANSALGFRQARTVQITPGQTTNVAIALPRGTINVNAVPWAQVWLDGQPLGETPLGNVSWTIGTHQLVLRHPDLGERTVSATITTGEPARVAVDMRRPQ